MSSNWVNALDACAAAGIIDYDAPAFLNGTNPRYIGHPQWEELPLKNDYLMPKGIKLKDVPPMDTYGNPEDKPLVNNPAWKKVLFGVVATAGLIAGAILLGKQGKKIKMPSFKAPKIKLPSITKFKSGITDIAKKVWKPIKTTFIWVSSKIKNKP